MSCQSAAACRHLHRGIFGRCRRWPISDLLQETNTPGCSKCCPCCPLFLSSRLISPKVSARWSNASHGLFSFCFISTLALSLRKTRKRNKEAKSPYFPYSVRIQAVFDLHHILFSYQRLVYLTAVQVPVCWAKFNSLGEPPPGAPRSHNMQLKTANNSPSMTCR